MPFPDDPEDLIEVRNYCHTFLRIVDGIAEGVDLLPDARGGTINFMKHNMYDKIHYFEANLYKALFIRLIYGLGKLNLIDCQAF